VNGCETLAHRGRHRKGDVLHAERCKDPLLHHLAEALAADALDDLATPIDVAAIFPFVVGIEQQRRHQRRLRAGNHAWLAVLLRQAQVIGVEEVVAKAGGVQHQHAGGDVALRRPQPWLAVSVEPVEHLELANVGNVGFCRSVQVELAFLDALQDRCPSDRFCGREDSEDGICRHCLTGAKDALAGGAFVNVGRAIRDHRHYAGNAVLASHDLLQDLVTCTFQVVTHRRSSRCQFDPALRAE
jgi:hypothetical protein